MAKLSYFINKSIINNRGEHPVFLRINHYKTRKLVAIHKTINPDYWDDDLCQIKGSLITVDKTKSIETTNYLKSLKKKMDENLAKYNRELDVLESKKPHLNIDDIVALVTKNKITRNYILKYMLEIITRLEKTGKIGNSKAYKNTHGVFSKFLDLRDIPFHELDYKKIKKFEEHLLSSNLKINAISFHMRTLRAVFNRAIKEGLVDQEYYPFDNYKIKREKTIKRAIIKGDISNIKNLDLSTEPELDKARDYFLFSFYARGMSFVDVAHLKVSNIYNDRIVYSRNKTDQKFTIQITPQIQEILSKYSDLKFDEVEVTYTQSGRTKTKIEKRDKFIFPIISNPDGDTYTQYRNALRLTNKKLKIIEDMLELPIRLTTYVSRHSWATIAKKEGVPTAVISEGLGHETEKTTQIYIDSFANDVLDEANVKITDV